MEEGGLAECGQSMRPPWSATWGRRGITPVIRVRGGGTGRVSVAGLACCLARRPELARLLGANPPIGYPVDVTLCIAIGRASLDAPTGSCV